MWYVRTLTLAAALLGTATAHAEVIQLLDNTQINGKILHQGRALVTIDLIGNDVMGDVMLVMQGRVLGPGEEPPQPAAGARIEGANLLVR